MNHFDPSRLRGEALRRDMDRALWQSVCEILGLSDTASKSPPRGRPVDYAAYSDLVLDHPKGIVLSQGARDEAASALKAQMVNGRPQQVHPESLPRIANFDLSGFSTDEIGRLDRWWDTEERNPMGLTQVTGDDFSDLRSRVLAAFDLMREADGELFGETLAIVDEIVLARPDGSQRFAYLAGSSFALWGGILINVDMHPDWTSIYKTLAHEAGHNLLFAIGREGGFVRNSVDEAYSSPVRDDPRPVDGIFHAAFVSARESRAFDRVLEWNETTGRLSQDEVSALDSLLDQSVIAFWQCCEALEQGASLTQLGQDVLRDCTDYMAANFELVTE